MRDSFSVSILESKSFTKSHVAARSDFSKVWIVAKCWTRASVLDASLA